MNPYTRLSAAVLKRHPDKAARVLEEFPPEAVGRFLGAANPDDAGQVAGNFTPGFAANCLANLELQAAGRIFSRLLSDQQILLLRLIEAERCESLLQTLPQDQAAALRRLLPYPPGTAGAIMEAPLASVPEELLVRHALKHVKRIRHGLKFYLYAINSKDQLTGVMTLHELINARPSSAISQIMHRHVIRLSPLQTIPALLNSPYWQDYHALPVTDEDDVLLGVIRQKSLRRIQEQHLQTDGIADGLNTFLAAGALFSATALQLLDTVIDTGRSLVEQEPHG